MFKCDKQRYRKYLETLHSSNNTMLFSRPVHDNSNHLRDTNLQNKINTQNKVHVKIFVLSFSLSVTSVCVFYVAVAAVLCDVVTLFKKSSAPTITATPTRTLTDFLVVYLVKSL